MDALRSNLMSFIPTLRGLRNELGQSEAYVVVRRNIKWLLVGLAIRLILMPIAAHGDLIFLVWASSFIAFRSAVWNPYFAVAAINPAWVPNYTVPFLFLEAAVLRLASFLIPDLPAFTAQLNLGDPLNPFLAGSPYYLYPHIHELLMLAKLPYLIFDISTGIVLSLVRGGTSKSNFLFRFWMLNPVAIFASFIFGQFDIIPTFFMVLAIYFINKLKFDAAAISLGLGAAFKTWPLLLLPTLVLGLAHSSVERVRLTFWGIVPFLITSLPFITDKAYVQAVLLNEQSLRIAAATINVGTFDMFAIFVAAYAVIVLHCFNSPRTPSVIWRWMFAILLSFYSLSLFNPQWFVWVAPLAGLASASNRKMLWYYVLLCVCFLVYTFNWGTALAGNLFAPLDPTFFRSLPAPKDLIAQIMDSNRFILLFRSVFTGTGLWTAYLALSTPNDNASSQV